ncbi:MAG: hypothetical protein L6R37_003728 [Teloschistes peruensis]|nr:MAG: hypothetical protein L6R37_003728 [Teloschistes peruensis]
MESREQLLSSQQQEQQQPSVDDIIDWHIEQCRNLAELGFTTNPPTIEAFNAHILTNPSPRPFLDDPLDDDDWAKLQDETLNEEAEDYNRAEERNEYIKTHPDLVAETQQEVHRRLIAAGKSQSDIDCYDAEQTPLRLRILDLHNLENGWFLGDKKTVPASLMYFEGSIQRSARINLNPRDSLSDFEHNAKSCLQSVQNPYRKLEDIYHEGRPWRYGLQPATQASPVGKGFCTLRSGRDYQNLISMVLKHGSAVLTQEEEQNSAILTPWWDFGQKEEMATPFLSADLLEYFDWLGTREIDMDNRASLAKFAAEERAQRSSSSNEEMMASRARHDQARVAHDNDRRARRAESLAPKDRHILQTRASRERSMTETGPVERIRKDGHGPQTRAKVAVAAAGRATSPERKTTVEAESRVGEQAAPSRRKSQRITAATSSKAQSTPSESNKNTPSERSESKRGGKRAANASPALSRTRSGKQHK